MVKILGIIQARMGSTRLPRKVMLPILNKPIIWHIFNRLTYCKTIDKICIATSTSNKDDKIETFALNQNIPIYRGKEIEIVERLLGASQKFKAHAIVRITGDCPLTDPKIIDMMVTQFNQKNNLDFLSNIIHRTFPDGLDVEVMSTDFLRRLLPMVKNKQEFFSSYMIKNHKRFKCINLENKENISNLRWTLDFKEDYEFIKRVYEELYHNSKCFFMNDILGLLLRKPELSNINKR